MNVFVSLISLSYTVLSILVNESNGISSDIIFFNTINLAIYIEIIWAISIKIKEIKREFYENLKVQLDIACESNVLSQLLPIKVYNTFNQRIRFF